MSAESEGAILCFETMIEWVVRIPCNNYRVHEHLLISAGSNLKPLRPAEISPPGVVFKIFSSFHTLIL